MLESLQTALADRYRIERKIGVGGMATVYLARDLRHDRPVALKILSPELGAVLGTERFLSEIRVTANLQHPNLLPLFDSGEAAGQLYYVMPYVEGESLRQRLDRERQLSVSEAVRIAAAVAMALDYAHRHGVIHRDLKPENILLSEGQPLVADFGIALAVSVAGGERITQSGLSLGTPQYMSPEQATGDRAVDARTDIYSLGAVLYEMLTAEPPHTGVTVQAIIARVVTDRPRSIRATRPSVPAYIEAAVLKALEKVPADRFENAKGFADVLLGDRPITLPVAVEQPAVDQERRKAWWSSPRTAWAVAGIATVAAAGLLIAMLTTDRTPANVSLPPVEFELNTTEKNEASPGPNMIAMSPDGQSLVYVGRFTAAQRLFLRTVGSRSITAIEGTEQGSQPFFSPDGKWIAFFAPGGQLLKVPREGGAVVKIATGVLDRPSTWGPNNEIIIPRVALTGRRSGLSVVPASASAKPRTLTRSDSANGENHFNPLVLPDGKNILLTNQGPGGTEDDYLALASIDGGAVKVFDVRAVKPLGYEFGHAIYTSGDGKVMAVPLDLSRREITGDPIAIRSGLALSSSAFLSTHGDLAYFGGTPGFELVRVDASGKAETLRDGVADYGWPRLSPDGSRVAVTVSTASRSDVWIYNIATATFTRINVGGSTAPEWTPDSKRVSYTIPNTNRLGMWMQMADGSSPPEPIKIEMKGLRAVSLFGAFSPDGKTFLFRATIGGIGRRDLYYTTVGTPDPAVPWLTTAADETGQRFSPDGKWVVYSSDESGQYEIYVRPFPGPGGLFQISTGGGVEPMWSRDGGKIFYRHGIMLIEATLSITPNEVGVKGRKDLFEWRAPLNPPGATYDVDKQGRFIMLRPAGEQGKIVVVLNWLSELKAKLEAAER